MKASPRLFRTTAVAIFLVTAALFSSLGLSIGARSESDPNLPSGNFVVRVYYDDLSDIRRLHSYDLWEYNNLAEQYVLVSSDRIGYEGLRRAGWRVTVDTEMTAGLQDRTPRFSGGYRTVEEIYAYLVGVNSTYGGITEIVAYGRSHCLEQGGCATLGGDRLSGFPLQAIRVTNEAIPGASRVVNGEITRGDKPVLFLMAGIHAREITTPEIALRFLDWLTQGYGRDAEATWLVDYHEIWIVPTANPDGHWLVELGEQSPYNSGPFYQRKNANNDANDDGRIDCPVWPPSVFSQYGVDLNRNHSFFWGSNGSSADPCNQTFRGSSPASEPEVSQLEGLIRQLIPDQRGPGINDPAPPDAAGIFISLHSFGDLVLWPWGYTNVDAPNWAGLRAIGDKLGSINGYFSCQPADCLYEASGTSDDWAYGELGIPAFTFEIGDEFMPPHAEVDAVQWPANRSALIYAARIARTPYITALGPDSRQAKAEISDDGRTLIVAALLDSAYNQARPITAAVFAVDLPFWNDDAVSVEMSAADGAYDSLVETVEGTINISALEPGRHIVYVRGRDDAGDWGAVTAAFFTVGPSPDFRVFLPLAVDR